MQKSQVVPENVMHSQDKLKLMLMDRRLRVKQNLYNAQSALELEKESRPFTNFDQRLTRPESQMLPKISKQLESEKSMQASTNAIDL